MVQLRDDVVGLDAAILGPARRLGGLGPPGHLHRPPGRLQELPRALAGRQDRRRLPQLRLARPDRGAGLQPHVQDPRRPGRGRGPRGLPAARDGPGHVHQLRQRARHHAQEAALRHRPGGQVLPQRDHPAELRVPHPRVRADGDGVLRPARRGADSGSTTGWPSACSGTSTSACRPTSCACATTRPSELSHYSRGTADVEFQFPWGWDELEGIANRGDFDLNAHAAALGRGAGLLRPADQRALHAAT